MPELPEVETIRRSLEKQVIGKTIKKIIIAPDFEKKITPSVPIFISSLIGKKILSLKRRAKILILDFGYNLKVLIHLKMTGQLIYQDGKKVIVGGHPIKQSLNQTLRFNKAQFFFKSGEKLYFNDIRKFGYLKLVSDSEAKAAQAVFGPEPIDKKFTFEVFNRILKIKKNLGIKKILLNQQLIAGLGNIYADESCHLAHINPTRKAGTLNKIERKVLFKAMRNILKKAIQYGGTSVNTYVDGLGNKGAYTQFLKVYGQVGKICQSCKKSTIKRLKFAGRGTNFCPNCQK